MASVLMRRLAAARRLIAPYFASPERQALRLGRFGVWDVPERSIARALLAAVVLLEIAQVGLAVLFNLWNARFYDALQAKDLDAFWRQMLLFCVLAAAFIIAGVYELYLNQWLQIRWRRFMTEHLLTDWLSDGTLYRMRLSGDATDNVDQRIANDISLFIVSTLTLGLGLLSSLASLGSFTIILWSISRAVPFTVFGYDVHVPGFLLWVAIAFSLAATLGAHLIGRPLAGLTFEQQKYEADFRFALVRLRENSEQVALLRGETVERGALGARFQSIVGNWYRIMNRRKLLTFFTAGYDQLAVVVPFVVAAPSYFSGRILLGTMTQTSGAFGQVQTAFSYFVTAYTQVAEYFAVIDRLAGLQDHVAAARESARHVRIAPIRSPGALLAVHDLGVVLPGGRALAAPVSFSLAPGESLLLRGRSGIGKTTLLRAIGGFWRQSLGRIEVREGARLMLLPQRPYMPLGTLRQALAYPMPADTVPKGKFVDVLRLVDLERLAPELDCVSAWADQLSVGEQQRISLARVLLARPDVIVLDEATSALDEQSEARLMRRLRHELPDAAIVSIGHRSTLTALHDRTIDLQPAESAVGA
ncbi:MAG: ABC transporter ATP-binding protein/permease [Proteobacteria bacterium]|nr:ABC transporter ATP-binding protein/permease [Pseudomonadota bacterium]